MHTRHDTTSDRKSERPAMHGVMSMPMLDMDWRGPLGRGSFMFGYNPPRGDSPLAYRFIYSLWEFWRMDGPVG
jgi:hypothetical protein